MIKNVRLKSGLVIGLLWANVSSAQMQIYMSELIGKTYERVVDEETGAVRAYEFMDVDEDGWASGVQRQFLPSPADPAFLVPVESYTLSFEIIETDNCGNCMIFQFEDKSKRYFSIQHDGGDFWIHESDEKFEKSDTTDIFYPSLTTASGFGENLSEGTTMLREIIAEVFSDERHYNWDNAVEGTDLTVYDDMGSGFMAESASSVLPGDDNFDYGMENAFDNDPYTTWFSNPETSDQYPLDESITFSGMVFNETIWILNGMQYSTEDFENNSRVKTLKLFVNGEYFALVTLQDQMGPQTIWLEGINAYQAGGNPVTIEFRIVDVYPGNEFSEAGISEIYTVAG